MLFEVPVIKYLPYCHCKLLMGTVEVKIKYEFMLR